MNMGIDALFPDFVKVPIMGLIVALFVLVQAARRYPHVEWLRPFYFPDRRTEAQKQRARHSGNIMAGIQMIGFGLVIPVGYAILDIMMFSTMSRPEMMIVSGCSILCVALGIFVMARARTL